MLALFSCLVQEEFTSNTEKKFPIDEAVFCGLVQGHSGIQSFFAFVSVSETVHELPAPGYNFPPLGIDVFFQYLKQIKSKESLKENR